MIEGLSGDHARLTKGQLHLHYHQFNERVQDYIQHSVPRFRALREAKMRLVHQAERHLRFVDLVEIGDAVDVEWALLPVYGV